MMQIRLKRMALGIGLSGVILAGCGESTTATVLPLPPIGRAVAAPTAAASNNAADLLDGTPVPPPDLPPGSGRLVYDAGELGVNQAIVIAPASGGAPQPANFSDEYRWFLGKTYHPWSPDRRLVIASRYDPVARQQVFAVADAAGAPTREVARIAASPDTAVQHFVWSPDSSKVAVGVYTLANNADRLYGAKALLVIDVAGGWSSSVVVDPGLNAEVLAWSPDSETLAFTTGQNHEPEFELTLQTIRWDGEDRRTLVRDVAISKMFWTRENIILFESDCDGSNVTELCQLDPASGKYQPLYQTPDPKDMLGFQSLSPDERWLFVQDFRRKSLFLINRTSGAITTVVSKIDGLYAYKSIWSPDSKYLAITDEDDHMHVYEIGAGRPLRPLIDQEVRGWLPDR
jgi:dipeptidyl aminopeptidase/acylaminoacyl peptidase